LNCLNGDDAIWNIVHSKRLPILLEYGLDSDETRIPPLAYTGWHVKVHQCQILIKVESNPDNQIRFRSQIKVSIKHYDIIRWH